MTDLLSIGILPVALTLIAFLLGQKIQKKLKSPLLNPILVAVVFVLIFLFLTGMPVSDYKAGMGSLSWLLTPATICLAVPMYEQFQILKKNLAAIIAGVTAGAVSCLIMVVLFGILVGFDPLLTVSLLPKSITTAIGALAFLIWTTLPPPNGPGNFWKRRRRRAKWCPAMICPRLLC